MQFNLRSLFVLVSVLAILFAGLRFVEVNWVAPARNGREALAKFNQLIAENKWDGSVVPIHYFRSVRILINRIDEAELKKLYPILHEIYWLRTISIDYPEVSEQMLHELQSEFPQCTIHAFVLAS